MRRRLPDPRKQSSREIARTLEAVSAYLNFLCAKHYIDEGFWKTFLMPVAGPVGLLVLEYGAYARALEAGRRVSINEGSLWIKERVEKNRPKPRSTHEIGDV